MSRATGLPAVSALSSVTSCSGHAGARVQMGVTPCASAVVGVSNGSMRSPGFGIATLAGSRTENAAVAVEPSMLTSAV